jgi:hypothetical protein
MASRRPASAAPAAEEDRMPDDAPDRIASARVRTLYGYWMEKRGSRRMPARADIDPAEIKPLLPYLLLADLHHDPLRVFYRLVGTGVVAAAKCDLTGHWLHQVDLDGNTPAWERVYRRVAETGAPVFGQTRADIRPGDARLFQWVVLPLSDDGAIADRVLELEDWEMLRLMSEADVKSATWTLEPMF